MKLKERRKLGLGKAAYKVEGGKMIKVQVTQKDGKIETIKIMGDFFLHPEELIEEMEEILIGFPLEEDRISISLKDLIEKKKAMLLGAAPKDFAKCILMASV